MRPIKPKAIAFFSVVTTANALLNICLGYYLHLQANISLIALCFIIPATFYMTNLISYRLIFYKFGFPLHVVHKNTTEDFAFQLYVLYQIVFFNSCIFSYFMPLIISKVFHQMLGTKFGSGSYCAGIILDPSYVEIGENSIIGFDAVLCSHALEGDNLSFEKITVGDHVTIGLRSMIMPGVVIEDHAIIAAGALIPKNTHVKKGEVWAGIPAKRIKSLLPPEESNLIDIKSSKIA